MAYSGRPYFNIPRPLRMKGFMERRTLAGHITLTARDSLIQAIDHDGVHRDVILPANADGLVYLISSTASSGAFNLVVKDTASPANTIATLANGETALIACDAVGFEQIFKI